MNFTCKELNEIWWALDTKINHLEELDKNNLNRIYSLCALQEKVGAMINHIKEVGGN